MTIGVDLPAVGFVEKTEGGKSWTQLVLPNTGSSGAPGTPGIPVSSSTIAVPDGAKLAVVATSKESYTLDNVELFPTQPEPVDQAPGALAPKPNFRAGEFSDGPFKFDGKAYGTDALVPAAAAFGQALGQARDLNIAGLHFPAAQYNPKTDKLQVLTHVDVQVTFVGGPKTFSDAARLAVGDRAAPDRRRPAERERRPQVRPADHLPAVRRGAARHHEPVDARAGEHVRDGAARRGLPDARRPDRPTVGPDRDDRHADPDVHPRAGQPPVLHPPELRDDHGRRRARPDVHDRARRDPVRQPVLDEERHRRAAGRGGRAACSATRRADRRAAREDHPLRDGRRRPGRCSTRPSWPRSSRTPTTSARSTTARRTGRSSSSPRPRATASRPAASPSTGSTRTTRRRRR